MFIFPVKSHSAIGILRQRLIELKTLVGVVKNYLLIGTIHKVYRLRSPSGIKG